MQFAASTQSLKQIAGYSSRMLSANHGVVAIALSSLMHQCNRYQLIAITSPSSSHQSRYQGDRSRRIAVTSRLPFADRGIFAIAISKSRPPQDRLSANRGSNALSELQHPRDCSHDSQYHHNCSLQIAASSRSLLRFAVSSRLLLRFTATIRSLLQIARYS